MTELGDIYRRAAEIVASSDFPMRANVVLYAMPGFTNFLSMDLFYAFFTERNWPLDEAHRPVRVTALLLMAAMADAGDL